MDIKYSNASEEEKAAFAQFLEEWNDENTSISVHTSGSTGVPKKITLSKKDMITSANQTINFLEIKKGGTSLICLSMDTIAGKMMAVRSILGDLSVIIGHVSSDPMNNMNDTIELCAMVPLQLETILQKDASSLQRIRHLLIGGAPLTEKVEREAARKNITFWHTYGMTETISHVALRKAGKNGEPFFTALPGITFSQENEQLIIHYPAIGIQALKTNDIVDLVSPTQFIYIGRADFIINSGGIKFNPETLENTIATIMDRPFFIGGIHDPSLGQKVVLFIEGDEDKIIDKEVLKQLLPKFAVPKEIVFVRAFIRTKSGKINRAETMKLFQ